MRIRSRIPLPRSLAASVGILAVLASTCVLQAATKTWTGSTSNVLNTPTNWSPGTLPTASGDIALWDGTQAGNLSLIWNAAWTHPGSGSTGGANILVTGDQEDSLTMTGSTNISLVSFEVQSGAGAVNFGVGTGSFSMIFRGGQTLTNNSSNTVTFGSNITAWQNGGGLVNRNVVFGGSGDWEIAGNYTNPGGGGAMVLTKNGTGTLTFNGSQNGGLNSGGANTLSTIAINQGTVKFGGSAQIGSAPATTYGVYSSTITNDGIFEWASVANQTLSGVISGEGALVQSGAGALTLSANNTYTGNTTVTEGTLIVSGSLSGSTIVSGGVLAGSGSLRAVDMESGAISPGTADSPIGTLNASSLTLGDTASSFNFDLSASDNTSDRISLTDAFNGGTGAYTFNFTGGMDNQTYTLVTFDLTEFTDVAQFSSTGVAGTFALGSSSLTFTAVPEPSMVAMLAGGLVVVFAFRRRISSL